VIVGKSTFGKGATGNRPYDAMPKTRTPNINNEVAIGRRIKGSEMLIGGCSQSKNEIELHYDICRSIDGLGWPPLSRATAENAESVGPEPEM
jgi:hypothetical protein